MLVSVDMHCSPIIYKEVSVTICKDSEITVLRCTRGDARSFFCTYKTYLYAQN